MTDLTPEIKEALKKQKENCIFCKIINGEVPAKKVIEDDHIIALMDINPARKGHILLMPKEHFPIMPFLPKETFMRLFEITRILGEAQKKAVVSHHFSVFIANGFAAGQQSQHFMVHLIPREPDDGLKLGELVSSAVELSSHDKLSGLISQNLSIMMENHFKRVPASWHTPREVPTHPALTIERIIQIVEQNPQLKDLIVNHPEEFLEQSKTHTQLREMFSSLDPLAVVLHYHPGFRERGNDGHGKAEDMPEKDREHNEEENGLMSEGGPTDDEKGSKKDDSKKIAHDKEEDDAGVSLDDISRLLG